jgi:poly(3-hydroxybutyrate) depolymerase
MLYEAYQVHSDILTPVRLAAEAARGFWSHPWPVVGDHPVLRGAAATCEFLSRAGMSHQRPDFGITETSCSDRPVAVREKPVYRHPFCTLLHFEKERRLEQPRVLVVAPMSGHFSTLLRDTVRTLLPDHDVYITDWINARNVPLYHGKFDLDDFIDLMIDFMHRLGPETHLLAVCQPAVPVLAAVSLMAAAGDPCQPRSMMLMGGPIDTRCNPTKPNLVATSRPLRWFEKKVVTAVPLRYPGAFRRVYPGFLQLAGFLAMNFGRHVSAHFQHFENLVRGDGESAGAHRAFYDEYMAVMDLPADFYLQTIQRVFQDHDLPRGIFLSRGRPVDADAVERTALLAVEGEKDDICSVGQTAAALDLCRNLPSGKKAYHLQEQVGHYGIFNGRRWRGEIYPKLRAFIQAHA